jgi:hypothetical protein
MSLSIYIIVALYSCVYAQRRLTRPGLRKDIRRFFLRKHYSYVGVFILVWTLNLAKVYYQLFNPEPAEKEEDTILVVAEISKYASFSTGLFLTIIRLSEPYFYYVTKRKWLEFFGVAPTNTDRSSNELYNNTLNSFLAESLNTELVNIILNGVTVFTKKNFEDHYNPNTVQDNEDKFSMLRKLEIQRIEIENFERENLDINATTDQSTV